MQPPTAETDAPKEVAPPLTIHHNPLIHQGDLATKDEPLAVHVAVKRSRLGLLTTVAVAVVAALTLVLSGRGIVLERFARDRVSIQDQEKRVEAYNAYSGTVASALERPLAWFLELVVPVIVLRLMTTYALDEEPHRVRAAVMAIGTLVAYLVGNGLSAVNVQVRELPVQLRITTDDLIAPLEVFTATTNASVTFGEDQDDNPMYNTLLRNSVLPSVADDQPTCAMDTSSGILIAGDDTVTYRFRKQPWMKALVPTARKVKSLQLAIAPSTPNATTPFDAFPMDALDAADLLAMAASTKAFSPWSATSDDASNIDRFFSDHDANGTEQVVPLARLSPLLPPSLDATEEQNRAWFWQRVSSTLYNISDKEYKNASLRSWNLTLSHVEIEPGVLWVDAVTIEREVASPRFETLNTTTEDDHKRYYELPYGVVDIPSGIVSVPSAANTEGESIYVKRLCRANRLEVKITKGKDTADPTCANLSTNALLAVGTGRRYVADAVVANATVKSSELVRGRGYGVVVNLREIETVTVARLRWGLQDLAARYHARCDAPGGCMGLDLALPGSGQRIVVNADALAVNRVVVSVDAPDPYYSTDPIVSVQRPQTCLVLSRRTRGVESNCPEYIGGFLFPHNVRDRFNESRESRTDTPGECVPRYVQRLANVVNNHVYMEHSLQPTYTAAALYLLQHGVALDVLNSSRTPQRQLAFRGNAQDVDVFVFIPKLNVVLTLVGCIVLVAAVAVVALWPQIALRGQPDPLARITTPQAIARVLVDSTAFPTLLLARSVAPSDATDDNASSYRIQSLALEATDDRMDRV